MDPTIAVAIIMMAGTVITQLVIAYVNKKATTEVINYRIGALEEKVMKHNNLMERMIVVEESTKSAHHRIDEMKEEL